MVSKKYGYRPVFILVRHVLALMLLICLMSRDYAIYAVLLYLDMVFSFSWL